MAKPRVRKNRITNLRVDEVSLVDHPANPAARVVLAKRDASADETIEKDDDEQDGELDGELDLDGTVLDADEQDGPELTDGSEGAEGESDLSLYTDALAESLASIDASDIDDKAALVTKSIKEFTAAVLAKVAAPASTDSTTITKNDSNLTETDTMPDANKDETLLKGLSPEAQESVQKAIAASLATVTERLTKAEGEATSLRNEIAKRDRLAKATKLVGNAPIAAEKVAEALEKAGDAAEVEAVITDLVAKLGEATKSGHVFEEIGKRGENASAGPEDELTKATSEIRKSNTKLTEEQAMQLALEQNPTLYDAFIAR